MAFDTLGFTKHLETRGIARDHAEAHAEAMAKFLLPELASKADLLAVEHRLTLRVLAIGAALNGILFTLLKLT
jgi:hypothetical protein